MILAKLKKRHTILKHTVACFRQHGYLKPAQIREKVSTNSFNGALSYQYLEWSVVIFIIKFNFKFKGRAGRQFPGIVYRIYTEKRFSSMDDFQLSEIVRSPLQV